MSPTMLLICQSMLAMFQFLNIGLGTSGLAGPKLQMAQLVIGAVCCGLSVVVTQMANQTVPPSHAQMMDAIKAQIEQTRAEQAAKEPPVPAVVVTQVEAK